MSKNENLVGYFVISSKTDNLLENKDLIELILGKREKYKVVDTTGIERMKIGYKIYILRANKSSNIKAFGDLIKEGDLSENDFKKITLNDLKELLLQKNKNITKVLHSNCKEIVDYIKEIRG